MVEFFFFLAVVTMFLYIIPAFNHVMVNIHLKIDRDIVFNKKKRIIYNNKKKDVRKMSRFKLVYVVFLIYFLRVVVSIIDSFIYLLIFNGF